jgi:hypothetical protein
VSELGQRPDLGISDGMKLGIERARMQRRPIEMRTIAGWETPGSRAQADPPQDPNARHQ